MSAFLLGPKLASLYCVGPADTRLADAFSHACGFTRMPMHLPPRMRVHTHTSLVASLLEVPSHWLLLSRHTTAGAGQAPALACLSASPVTMQSWQCMPSVWHHCPCPTHVAAHTTTGVCPVPMQLQHIGIHGVVALFLYMPVVLSPTRHCVTVT